MVCVPGKLKSKTEQKRLLIEKLMKIDGTKELIADIEKNFIYSALSKCNNIELTDHMRNKIERLKWQV
jgi:hypothetical protein